MPAKFIALVLCDFQLPGRCLFRTKGLEFEASCKQNLRNEEKPQQHKQQQQKLVLNWAVAAFTVATRILMRPYC